MGQWAAAAERLHMIEQAMQRFFLLWVADLMVAEGVERLFADLEAHGGDKPPEYAD